MAEVKRGELRGYPERTILSQAFHESELKVQRLSRKGVHSSEWKRHALSQSDIDDIV